MVSNEDIPESIVRKPVTAKAEFQITMADSIAMICDSREQFFDR